VFQIKSIVSLLSRTPPDLNTSIRISIGDASSQTQVHNTERDLLSPVSKTRKRLR